MGSVTTATAASKDVEARGNLQRRLRSFWYVDIHRYADRRRAAEAAVTTLYAEHALGLVRLASC